MWSILDHLNALIVIPIIIVIMIATQWEGQGARITSTIQASGGGIYLTADWIERDLTNLGAGVDDDTEPIVDFAWGPDARWFTFRTGTDTTLAAPPVVVRYEAEEIEGGRHELRRYVVGESGVTLTGQSPATLRTVSIRLLDDRGEEVAEGAIALVHSVDVRLVLDPPLGETGTEVTWTRRFFPPALTNPT